jgi:hypothetical protein
MTRTTKSNPFPEYCIVKVVNLIKPSRPFEGTEAVKESPKIDDVGTVVHVVGQTGGKSPIYIVENVAITGETVWLADFQHEELEIVSSVKRSE